MQDLVREAAGQDRDAADPAALAAQARLFRSAVLAGAAQTAARSGALMKKHHALARRTMAGARQFCAIRSYLSTAAKHGLGLFDALVMLTEGQPALDARRRLSKHNTLPVPDQLLMMMLRNGSPLP
jgi:hypothetical protein